MTTTLPPASSTRTPAEERATPPAHAPAPAAALTAPRPIPPPPLAAPLTAERTCVARCAVGRTGYRTADELALAVHRADEDGGPADGVHISRVHRSRDLR